MRVYLAGPINGRTDEECKAWRAEVKRKMPAHVVCVDPMARDYRGREALTVNAIIEGDKRDIQSCDAMIAFCPQPSVGTSMEIFYAWFHGLRVLVVVPPMALISPWLRYHSEAVVDDLDVAIVQTVTWESYR